MTLATTCPECGTTFKVIPDQLKLRRGLVRCGVCAHVFSGLDGLRYLDDSQGPTAAPPGDAPRDSSQDQAYVLRAPARQHPAESDAPLELRAEAALANVSLERVDEDDFRLEPLAADTSADAQAGDFLAAPRRPWIGFPRFAPLGWAVIAVLVSLLGAQAMLGARYWIADRLPALGPGLAMAAVAVGLSDEPPRDLDALTLESFELQASGGQSPLYAASAILRNHSARPVRWPAMELALTDASGALLVRRVLLADEYLPVTKASSMARGIPRGAEVPVRVGLEITTIVPAGYKVSLFYP